MCYNVAVYRYSFLTGLVQVASSDNADVRGAKLNAEVALRALEGALVDWLHTSKGLIYGAVGSHFAIIAKTK